VEKELLKIAIKNAVKEALVENAVFEYKFDSSGYLLDGFKGVFTTADKGEAEKRKRLCEKFGTFVNVVGDGSGNFSLKKS
jgi:hypothetical protein